MKKMSYLTVLICIFSVHIFSQSTYSGNLSVSDDLFFEKYSDVDHYVGGCNAFPIGTFVNVKLPYSDDSVNVKIVRRIPEDGIFVLIEKSAGKKLELETGDVLPVRIQVVDFTPPPLSSIEDIDELDPEPEIKGLTALNLLEEETPEEITPEKGIEDEVDEATMPEDEPLLETVVKEEPLEELATEEEIFEEFSTENEIVSIPEPGVEATIEEPTGEKLETEAAMEPVLKESIDDGIKSEVAVNAELEEPAVADEPVAEKEIFEDELPGESMFSEKVKIGEGLSELPEELDETPKLDTEGKIVKRIFFLEPADRKPPVGGVMDSDLIPVTPLDDTRSLEDGYYLQVGYYENSDTVDRDKEVLTSMNFPYITVVDKDLEERERLLVGPLSNDELGVIMLHLKNRGFYDFFRYKKKIDN